MTMKKSEKEKKAKREEGEGTKVQKDSRPI